METLLLRQVHSLAQFESGSKQCLQACPVKLRPEWVIYNACCLAVVREKHSTSFIIRPAGCSRVQSSVRAIINPVLPPLRWTWRQHADELLCCANGMRRDCYSYGDPGAFCFVLLIKTRKLPSSSVAIHPLKHCAVWIAKDRSLPLYSQTIALELADRSGKLVPLRDANAYCEQSHAITAPSCRLAGSCVLAL